MGPPGAGKGTQSSWVASHCDVPTISTGDMFRALQTADTALAAQVRETMARGGYVDDDTTNAIVADRLGAPDSSVGFLLDGYPRTLSQVRALDDMLAAAVERLDAVICLQADEEELVQRLLGRGLEQGRTDDSESTIRSRLALYRQQTAPLIDEYRRRGLLAEVDGLGAVELVSERIHQALTALTS
jgi:adenylate kinase